VLGAAAVGAWVGSASGSATPEKQCSAAAPATTRSARPGAGTKLVPPGAMALVLCRYDGPLGSPGAHLKNRFRLVASRSLSDPNQVNALAAAFNRLPRARGSYACPADTGAVVIGSFGYASGPDSPVRVDLTGCTIATNGHVFSSAGLGQTALLDDLEALVHASSARGGRSRGGGSGVITGYIRVCGGPAPGGCSIEMIGGCAPSDGCLEADQVIAVDSTGKAAAKQLLAPRHARFRLQVRPGNYVVELLADGRHVHDRLLQAAGVTVRPGHAARIVFRFDVP
jgi:hypothetical protein